jgi:hypothetical protein
LDVIPGDGMNEVSQEVQIVFNTLAPQQFFRDKDILADVSLGLITLVKTPDMNAGP